jgi:hypothetical protein
MTNRTLGLGCIELNGSYLHTSLNHFGVEVLAFSKPSNWTEMGNRLVHLLCSRTYFLTTICHGNVLAKGRILDDTAKGLMRGLKITKDHASLFRLQRNSIIPVNTAGTGSTNLRPLTPAQVPSDRITYAPKAHYRIVSKEVGVTIDSLRNLPGVMDALTETVSGAF